MSKISSDIPTTMRGVQLVGYGGIDQLVFRDNIPTPDPLAGEVLVRVGACGINNTDINLRTQWYDRTTDEAVTSEVGIMGTKGSKDYAAGASWNTETVHFPRIQGAAVAGTIVATGAGVPPDRIGERVILDPQIRDLSLPPYAQLVAYLGGDRDGGFAEYVAIPAENAHKHNSSLSDAELATFPTSYDTAEEMLVRTRLAAGETVLVTGASGGVGTALIQLAKARNAQVIALASESKRDALIDIGADYVIGREQGNLVKTVESIVGSRNVQVVADVIGGKMFPDMLKILARGGRYSSSGAIAGPVQSIDLRDLIYKDLQMFGITCPGVETFAKVIRLVEEHKIRPLLNRSFALRDLPEAQAQFVQRKHIGKFVITV